MPRTTSKTSRSSSRRPKTTRTRRTTQTRWERFKLWYGEFKNTKVGTITLSATRAFLGVFILAQAQLFDALDGLVKGEVEFSFILGLLASLASAGVTAAIRAVQLYFFDEPANRALGKKSRARKR